MEARSKASEKRLRAALKNAVKLVAQCCQARRYKLPMHDLYDTRIVSTYVANNMTRPNVMPLTGSILTKRDVRTEMMYTSCKS
jgi:hypothetical protein